jgi:hypothetical protein
MSLNLSRVVFSNVEHAVQLHCTLSNALCRYAHLQMQAHTSGPQMFSWLPFALFLVAATNTCHGVLDGSINYGADVVVSYCRRSGVAVKQTPRSCSHVCMH